ncbi:MAG: cbb3-type cytochrome oxidase assembly protein CcoS [Proteobacteria bacterium]|nr:cbb3-type cytochrome oxidase assembly protein CcoS [Pseudomonadota bacterium]
MTVLGILIPVSIGLGLIGLVAFLWTLKHNQYDDLEGDQARILFDEKDEPEE